MVVAAVLDEGEGEGPTVEEVQAACPTEVAACEAASPCMDDLEATLAGTEVGSPGAELEAVMES